VQQVKLPCTTFDSLLDHKSSSSSSNSSTTTWRRGRSLRKSLLLRVCVHPPAILLYPSTNFAVHRTSSQSTRNRNRGGNQRSRQL
jgi:hypothetical protein